MASVEEDDQHQRELDVLLRTPANLTGPIREIETQVRLAGISLLYTIRALLGRG